MIKNRRIIIIDDNKDIHNDYRAILLRKDPGNNFNNFFEDMLKENPPLPHFDKGGLREFTGEKPIEYIIDSAYQGEEGFEMIKKACIEGNPYAAAFIDMRMPPGWDGLKTIKHICSVDAEIQMVICTAYSDYSLEDIKDNIGNTDRLLILKKPFEFIEVQQMAAALTEKWNLAKEKIEWLAKYDSLTKLPNRTTFNQILSKEINRVNRSHERFAVLFVDIDHFKNINDTFGLKAGDLTLQKVSAILISCIRGHDTIARLGGDEFTCLITQIKNSKEAAILCDRIITLLKEPLIIDNSPIYVTASIGISIYPDNSNKLEQLTQCAESAMQYAKECGRNNYKFFNKEMNGQIENIKKYENDLRAALEKGEFVLYYQPIIELFSQKILGMEALIRWNHPKRGLIPPNDFIPLAEDIGIIIPMTEWIINTACRQNKIWHEKGCPHMKMNVNISAKHFYQGDLAGVIAAALKENKIDARYLDLEITETAVMQYSKEAADILSRLKNMGCHISLDDFGTGYSSLSYLKTLPLTTIKIDRSFISDILANKQNFVIADTIIELAHRLNLSVVAEGIETKEQFEFLQGINCDMGQGYYFYKPAPALEIERNLPLAP